MNLENDPENCGSCGSRCAPASPFCSRGGCATVCTTTVTSALSEPNPYGQAITVAYSMVGGGGGGPGSYGPGINTNVCAGGGGGGSSAIVAAGAVVDVAAGGGGGASTETSGQVGGSGTAVSGSFDLALQATLAVYVGGGGGGAYADKGGGGASGYYGGGGGSGDLPGGGGIDGGLVYFDAGAVFCGGGGGGSDLGGAAGEVTGDPSVGGPVAGIAGGEDSGGNGGGSIGVLYPGQSNWGGGNGGNGDNGGPPNGYFEAYGAGGGGGGFGGGGGGGGCEGPVYYYGICDGAAGGSEGMNGQTLPGEGPGGLGATTWAAATTLPGAAGAGGVWVIPGSGPWAFGSGGNAGLVILTYTPPDGVCRL